VIASYEPDAEDETLAALRRRAASAGQRSSAKILPFVRPTRAAS